GRYAQARDGQAIARVDVKIVGQWGDEDGGTKAIRNGGNRVGLNDGTDVGLVTGESERAGAATDDAAGGDEFAMVGGGNSEGAARRGIEAGEEPAAEAKVGVGFPVRTVARQGEVGQADIHFVAQGAPCDDELAVGLGRQAKGDVATGTDGGGFGA